jgi:hypothetical protein
VSANNRRINQQMFEVAVSRKMLEQFFKDAELAPAVKALINRIPVAVLFWKQSPLRTRASNPKHGFEETAHVAPGSETNLGAGF